MSPRRRVLVAGIGSVFSADDGFGVEVARRLAGVELPPGVVVADFGIRGIHLSFELLEMLDLLVAVDVVRRGGAPGTLYVLDPDVDGIGSIGADVHAMQLPAVFAAVRAMGGALPRVLVVGCEPDVGEGTEPSEAVQRAIDPAVQLVCEVVRRETRAGVHEARDESP